MSRHRRIIESITEFAVIATDGDGIVTEWNIGAERILGWTADEMTGRSAKIIFTPEDRAVGQVEKEMVSSLREGRGIDERWHMKADGTRFWASGEMMPLREDDGTPVGFVKILRDRTAQKLAEKALKESEQRYRTLYDSLDEGFCILEVRTDEEGRPADYRFLETNLAFERQTGLKDAAGKWMRDLAPEHEAHWYEIYGRIAASRLPERFEQRAKALGDRWFEVYAYPIDGTGQVAVTFNDISGRIRHQRRQDALLTLGDRLRDLSAPNEIAFVACEIMAEALDCGLVGYGDVDPVAETITVGRDFTAPGVGSLAGTLQFRDFGSYVDDLKRGRTVIVRDCESDPRTRDFAEALEERHARAFVNTPVFERGHFVALSYVSTDKPRNWNDGELGFIREVGDRVRVASERARGEQALRRSDERQRMALAIGEIGIFDLNLATGELVWDDRVRAAFGVFPGRTIGQAEKFRAVHPADRAAFDAAFAATMAGGVFDLEFRTVGINDAKIRWVLVQGRLVESADGQRNFIGAIRDISERIAAEEQRVVLNAELAHRLKNTLALVSSIITQTLRSSPDIAAARKTLSDRVQALSKAHDILLTGQRDAASVAEIVRSATTLHDEGGRLQLRGPQVTLGPKASLTLSLILHELATNAAKYGALSVPAGHVLVEWSVADDPATKRPDLAFEWREVGGPPVTAPDRKSFGTRLIEMGLSGAAESSAELDYARDGLICHLRASLTELQQDEPDAR